MCCSSSHSQMQAGEIQPFVEQILLNITAIICDLQPHQVSEALPAHP